MNAERPKGVFDGAGAAELCPLLVEGENASEPSFDEKASDELHGRLVKEQVTHHEDAIQPLCCADKFFGVGHDQCHRFFDEDIAAGLQGLEGDLVVGGGRRRDGDSGDVTPSEQIMVIGRHWDFGINIPDARMLSGIEVRHPGQGAEFVESPDDIAAPGASADDTNLHIKPWSPDRDESAHSPWHCGCR